MKGDLQIDYVDFLLWRIYKIPNDTCIVSTNLDKYYGVL